jgi:hypothetical protein
MALRSTLFRDTEYRTHRALPFWLGLSIAAVIGMGAASANAQNFPIRTIQNPPNYWGTRDGSALCGQNWTMVGHEPVTTGRRPVFFYFLGTITPGQFQPDPSGDAVLRVMAAKGYVAFQVQYDNGLAVGPQPFHNKAACMFDPSRAHSLVSAVCARSNVDCNLGITTWGHSQGGAMAAMAGSYDSRVRAAWVTGLGDGFGTRAWVRRFMLTERLRLVNGVNDFLAAFPDVMNDITGRSCTTSPCLTGPNGSGWLLVQAGDLAQNQPDHCWFGKRNGCLDQGSNQDPNWINGSQQFSLGPSASWLVATAALGPAGARWVVADFAHYPAGGVTGIYPWGVIDWGPADLFGQPTGNFRAANGFAGLLSPPPAVAQPRHVTIGTSSAAATGSFTFYAPQGRTLAWFSAYNSSSNATQVTTQITYADGRPATSRTDPVAALSWITVPVAAERAKVVRITSNNGNLLKFDHFATHGDAPSATPRGPCPAPRLALRAHNGRYVTAATAAPNALTASATAIAARETFTCEQRGTSIALRASDGRYVSADLTLANAQLVANRTAASIWELFEAIDIGSGTVVLKAGANSQFVSADALLAGTPLVANRAAPATWEQFAVVPR